MEFYKTTEHKNVIKILETCKSILITSPNKNQYLYYIRPMRNEPRKLRVKIRIPVAKRSLQHPKTNPLIFPDLQQSALQPTALQNIHPTGNN